MVVHRRSCFVDRLIFSRTVGVLGFYDSHVFPHCEFNRLKIFLKIKLVVVAKKILSKFKANKINFRNNQPKLCSVHNTM